MKFLREIPKSKITQPEIVNLEQCGFTLINKEDSVEVWVEEAAS